MLPKVIFNIVVRQHGLPDSIVSDRDSVFTSKFQSFLYQFLSIKQRLFIVFYFQTNGQIKQQNSIMEAYLKAFINYEKDNWARFLLLAEFAYNNAKHTSTGYTPFKFNCRYHPRISHRKDVNCHSRSKTVDKLNEKLENLMAAYKKNLQYA